MIKVKKENILLQKTPFEFENEGVLNPATIREGDCVHLFYRAVHKGNCSSIGYCRLDGPLTVAGRSNQPILFPELDFESQGMEDPRIVRIDDLYYLTYTGYDGINARGALATSRDLIHFERKGIIVPNITYRAFLNLSEKVGQINKKYYQNQDFYLQTASPQNDIILWDKDIVFFPRRINGDLVFLHRIRPGIQLVSVQNIEELTEDFWMDYLPHLQDHILMDPVYKHESSYIGGGCPPIEIAHGWLLIYHGVEETQHGLVYCACAALLDLENPFKVLARLPKALFLPEHEWKSHGEANNVVFPTGTAVFGNTLFIYYGAADTHIACASVNLPALLAELLSNTQKG
jgi:beta-1,2-mannobiose phosphorylase / 1,2-beta-oligomannan phosphorylase